MRYRHMFDNCSWFHWKSVTQLEGESVFLSNCPVLYWQSMLFLHIILQWCCSSICSFAVSVSGNLWPCSLSFIALDQSGCLKSGMADWEAGERCSLWKQDAHFGPWGNICDWVSVGCWFLWDLWTRLKHLPSFSWHIFPLNLSDSLFFGLQLSKKDLFLVVATKRQKFL